MNKIKTLRYILFATNWLIFSLPLIIHAQSRINERQAMNKGTCGKLMGTVAVLVVPVGSPQQKWDEAHLLQFRKHASRASRWLERSAKSCGEKLELHVICHLGKTLQLEVKDTCPSLSDILPNSIGEDSLASYLETNVLPYKFDQAVVIYVVQCHGRAFARVTASNRSEKYYESIWYPFPLNEMDNPDEHAAAIAHEILHLFGAMDFYHLKSVPPAIQATIARSIMLMPAEVPFEEWEVDPITQYLIGWRKKPEKSWKAIFKQPNLELMAY